VLKPTNALNVEMWISRDSWSGITSTEQLISNTESSGYLLKVDNTKGLEAWLYIGGSYKLVNTPLSVMNTGGNHISLNYDGSKISLYVNGIEKNSTAISGAITYSASDKTFIGAEYELSASPINFYNGEIDELRIWNISRSSDDINSSMNHQLDGNETGLAGYYNFDERIGTTVKDITSNSNDGLSNGNVTRLNFLGNGLIFDGSNDYVSVSHFDMNNSSYSINAWVNASASLSGDKHIFSDSDSTDFGFYIADNSSVYHLCLSHNGDTSYNSNYCSTTAFSKDGWQFVSATFDNVTNELKLYMNGQVVHTSTYTNDINATQTSSRIGSYNNGSSFFDGEISNLSLWSKVLSANEIKVYMNSSLKGNESSLEAYWILDEGTGVTANDNSINTNTGSIFGSAVWTYTAPTIHGNKIYTSNYVNTKQTLVVENNTATPTYSYNGSVPLTISNFNGSSGLFIYTAGGNESLDINASDGGTQLNTLFKVISYSNPVSIKLNLSDVNLSVFNIISISAIGQDGNSESLTIAPSYTYVNGDNNISSPIFNVDQKFSIRVDTNTSGVFQNWWINFKDKKLYQINDFSADFKVNVSYALNTFDFSTLSTNLVPSPLKISTIYDRFRRPGFSPNIVIPFDVNGTVGSSIDLNVTLTNSIVSATLASASVSANTNTNLTLAAVGTTIGSVNVTITATDTNTSAYVSKFFHVEVSNEYDIISTKEASVGSVADFNGTLYILSSHLDHNLSVETEIEKVDILNSTHTTFTELEDINGTVTVATKAENIPGTFGYDISAINYSSLSSLYTSYGTPFTFTDTNSSGQKVYVTYTSDFLEFHNNDDEGFKIKGDSGFYTSINSFMADQIIGKNNYGVLRSNDRKRFLLLDETEDLTASNGTLKEFDENGTLLSTTATWSRATIVTKDSVILNTSTLTGYRTDVAIALDTDGKVKGAEYKTSGDIYSYILLNKEAKNELYKSISPNPKIEISLIANSYTYISHSHVKTLCDVSLQSAYPSICDLNNTIESVFGSNIKVLLKHPETWTYWDSNSSLDSNLLMNKFSAINSLEGIIVKSSAATKLRLPYDDANNINDYSGMIKDKWYLLSNNKSQTITEIVSSASSSSKSILYIVIFRNGLWHIYAPTNDSSISTSLPRLTNINRHESYWIIFK